MNNETKKKPGLKFSLRPQFESLCNYHSEFLNFQLSIYKQNFISLLCLVASIKTSYIILNRRDESGHHYFNFGQSF